MFDLSGRVAVITGGASGLGASIAEVLAAQGARVVVFDRTGSEPVDVTDGEALRRAFDRVVDQHGRLDIVVANAGISGGPGPSHPDGTIENVSMAEWQRVLAVNLTGAFQTMQCAALHMRSRKSGRIIVMTSAAALHAEPFVGYAYAASKAALAQIVRLAAVELAPHNVLVNAIAPGPFATAIADGAFQNERIQQILAKGVPLGRIGQPSEIQGLALLLASDASRFITGAVLPIDGGSLA